MTAQQISVFLENKPGGLARITRVFRRENINIRATTISTSDAFGVVNLIVDKTDLAQKVLSAEGLMVALKDVIAVLIEDRPGGLDELTQLLYRDNINVNNAYGFVLEANKSAVFVVDVDQMPKALEAIGKSGYKLLDSEALSRF